MRKSKRSSSSTGILTVVGIAILIPIIASTFNSCDKKKSSQTVTVQNTPPPTPTPVPVPVPVPVPTPNPIPGLQNAWVPLNSTNPPAARRNHSAVWTGTRMIVWGGENATGFLNDGAALDPLTGTWTTIATAGAPAARSGHRAVLLNGRMIVWGGKNATTYFNDAYSYDPTLNAWTALTFGNQVAARAMFSATSTGSAMLIWGGISNVQPTGFSDGGYYAPNMPWSTLVGADPVLKRIAQSAIWTGSSMIMFGGANNNVTSQDGFIFNPNTLVFTFMALTANTPSARQEHTAVWDGQHMILWGGLLNGITTSYYNDGRVYDLATNTWLIMNNTGSASARAGHTAVWAGDAMIVWGGANGNPITYLNDGAVFH